LKPQFLLGLTATPFRGDGKDISEYYGDVLAAWFPLERAIAEDLLTPVDYRVVSDRVEEKKLASLARSLGHVSPNDCNLFSPVDDGLIVDTVMNESAKIDGRRRILAFCSSIEQMDHFAELMPDARTISGRDSRENQVELIEQLRAGKFEVLLSRDVLNEGIDVPHVSSLVFLRNTESATVFNQQLGGVFVRLMVKIASTYSTLSTPCRGSSLYTSSSPVLIPNRRPVATRHPQHDHRSPWMTLPDP
jgi:superfamily II DNA or RNA helicase